MQQERESIAGRGKSKCRALEGRERMAPLRVVKEFWLIERQNCKWKGQEMKSGSRVMGRRIRDLRRHIKEFGLYLEGKGTLWEVADWGGMRWRDYLGAEAGWAEEKPNGRRLPSCRGAVWPELGGSGHEGNGHVLENHKAPSSPHKRDLSPSTQPASFPPLNSRRLPSPLSCLLCS